MSMLLAAVCSDSMAGARMKEAKVRTRYDGLFLRCSRLSNSFVKLNGSMQGEKAEVDAKKNLESISK